MDYYDGGDLEKPYLISGADDRQVKIWDYQVYELCLSWFGFSPSFSSFNLQNRNCVQTLSGHAHNISAVSFHPDLPIILSGSEDGKSLIADRNFRIVTLY